MVNSCQKPTSRPSAWSFSPYSMRCFSTGQTGSPHRDPAPPASRTAGNDLTGASRSCVGWRGGHSLLSRALGLFPGCFFFHVGRRHLRSPSAWKMRVGPGDVALHLSAFVEGRRRGRVGVCVRPPTWVGSTDLEVSISCLISYSRAPSLLPLCPKLP